MTGNEGLVAERIRANAEPRPCSKWASASTLRLMWMNGAAERVFGYAATELLGQSLDTLLNEPQDLAAGFEGQAVQHKAAEAQISASKCRSVAGRRTAGCS